MTTLAVGNRRLLRLAEILEKVPNTKEKDGRPKFWMNAYYHTCGTPACAMGWWAAANPRRWTREVGFPCRRQEARPDYQTSYAQFIDEFALESAEDVNVLFSYDGMNGAKTGKAAAKFIRAFVKKRTPKAVHK